MEEQKNRKMTFKEQFVEFEKLNKVGWFFATLLTIFFTVAYLIGLLAGYLIWGC